jgi:formylglycine-generating enzyme required for sulfatase activity
MVNVSFWDGLAFLNRLSEQAGLPSCYDLTACSGEVGHEFSCESVRTTTYPIYTCSGYRLPTEAEWEYASRAGTRTAFNLGDVVPVEDCEHKQPALEPMAWYCGNSERRAHDVAQKQPNGWGLYDMAGNVQEWCNDLYATYPNGPLVDPVGRLTANADITGGSDRPRILRGGDFGTLVPLLKNSWHNYASDRGYGINVGLRFARTLP